MTPLIEAQPPSSWQNLEAQVAQVLMDCGYDVQVQKNVSLARGKAVIDVWADDHSSPQNILAIECKHWFRRATKTVVHAFRTVVGDSGANTGLIVSSAGFQTGAVQAAEYSNVHLLDWSKFEEMFAIRWFEHYMSPKIAEETDALHEYTESINTRIFRKADALSPGLREHFKLLRKRYLPLAACNLGFHPMLHGVLDLDASRLPILPLRESTKTRSQADLINSLPNDVLDAAALRSLMNALIDHSQHAIAEFDEIFGERA